MLFMVATSSVRIDARIGEQLTSMVSAATPPRLCRAIAHAVAGPASRLRPSLCLTVGAACGAAEAPGLLDCAIAIELLHCASLVHDDLPCFDDAELRRSKPAVHRAFGEPLAVLAGDALIVHALELAASPQIPSEHQRTVLIELVRAAGLRGGLIAGQGWESEPVAPDIARYHRAKTSSLFELAAALGATLAGSREVEAWRAYGRRVGSAYQVADDLLDVKNEGEPDPSMEPVPRPLAPIGRRPASPPHARPDPGVRPRPLGPRAPHRSTPHDALPEKSGGRDRLLGRPNAALRWGVPAARAHLHALEHELYETLPACPRPRVMRAWVERLRAKLAEVLPPEPFGPATTANSAPPSPETPIAATASGTESEMQR